MGFGVFFISAVGRIMDMTSSTVTLIIFLEHLNIAFIIFYNSFSTFKTGLPLVISALWNQLFPLQWHSNHNCGVNDILIHCIWTKSICYCSSYAVANCLQWSPYLFWYFMWGGRAAPEGGQEKEVNFGFHRVQ